MVVTSEVLGDMMYMADRFSCT